METKTKKDLSKTPIADVAKQLVQKAWNRSDGVGRASLIFKLIMPNQNFDEMLAFLKKEEERMKRNPNDFNSYYGYDIIELAEYFQKDFNTPFGVDCIIEAIRNDRMLSAYNWKNFNTLCEEKLFDMFSNFDDNFRGNISKVHRVYNNKYIIIETGDIKKQSRFDENNADECHFYVAEQDISSMRLCTSCFLNFESAMLYAMMGDKHFSAVETLYKDSRNQK